MTRLGDFYMVDSFVAGRAGAYARGYHDGRYNHHWAELAADCASTAVGGDGVALRCESALQGLYSHNRIRFLSHHFVDLYLAHVRLGVPLRVQIAWI